MAKNIFKIAVIAFSIGYTFTVMSQSNDITFKIGQVFNNSNKTDTPGSISTTSVTVNRGISMELGYRFYFKNDNFIKLFCGYGISNNTGKTTTIRGFTEMDDNSNEKIKNYNVNFEFGKRLNYKFIDFLAGVGTGFYNTPSHKAYDNLKSTQTPTVPNQLDEGHSVTSVPGNIGVNLYLNISLYFKMYKPLYIGIEVTNGFNYNKQKGTQTDEQSETHIGGAVYTSSTQKDINSSQFSMQLLRTQLGIRYFFSIAKKPEIIVE